VNSNKSYQLVRLYLSACFVDTVLASSSLEHIIPGATSPSTREGKRISDNFRTPSMWDVSVSLPDSSPSEASLALSLCSSSSELANVIILGFCSHNWTKLYLNSSVLPKKGLSLSVTGSGAPWLLKFALLGMSAGKMDESVASVASPIVLEIVCSKLSRCFISCLATTVQRARLGRLFRGDCRIGF
jgi:hypothetical protein